MFDDFHESTRGVGVLGILLGILVLAGFCGLGMAVMSGEMGRGHDIATRLMDQERHRDHVTKTLKTKKRELESLRKIEKVSRETMEKHADASGSMETEEELSTELQAERDQLRAEVEDLVGDFHKYREIYRSNERARAKGETLDLSETKGVKFAKCRVRKITPLNLHVMLAAGPLGIPYTDLPASIQDRFQFSKEEAAAYQGKLNATTAVMTKRAEEGEALRREKRAGEEREALLAAIKKVRDDIKAKEAYAQEQDSLANHWELEALGYDRQARDARDGGRITSGAGQARQARAKSTMYARRALAARTELIQMAEEEGEHQRRLKARK
jgi:hypothetical protein